MIGPSATDSLCTVEHRIDQAIGDIHDALAASGHLMDRHERTELESALEDLRKTITRVEALVDATNYVARRTRQFN